MNNFWSLVGFEYKKIFSRKSIFLVVILGVVFSTFTIGTDMITQNNTYTKNQKQAVDLVSGYFDDDMISDVISKSKALHINSDTNLYEEPIYGEFFLPYQRIYYELIIKLSPLGHWNYDEFHSLQPEDMIDYYTLRSNQLIESARLNSSSEKEIQAMISLNNQVQVPFYYGYTSAYSHYYMNMSISSILLLFTLLIAIIPVFSTEHDLSTIGTILSTKHGKKIVIYAKMFVVITFTLAFSLITLGLSLLTINLLFGVSNGDISFQIFNFNSVYPITMSESIKIYSLIYIVTALFLSSFAMSISSKFKSFVSFIIASLLVIGGSFISTESDYIKFLFPAKMIDAREVFSEELVNIFGNYIPPYNFIIIISTILFIILISIAYHNFKNHQTG